MASPQGRAEAARAAQSAAAEALSPDKHAAAAGAHEDGGDDAAASGSDADVFNRTLDDIAERLPAAGLPAVVSAVLEIHSKRERTRLRAGHTHFLLQATSSLAQQDERDVLDDVERCARVAAFATLFRRLFDTACRLEKRYIEQTHLMLDGLTKLRHCLQQLQDDNSDQIQQIRSWRAYLKRLQRDMAHEMQDYPQTYLAVDDLQPLVAFTLAHGASSKAFETHTGEEGVGESVRLLRAVDSEVEFDDAQDAVVKTLDALQVLTPLFFQTHPSTNAVDAKMKQLLDEAQQLRTEALEKRLAQADAENAAFKDENARLLTEVADMQGMIRVWRKAAEENKRKVMDLELKLGVVSDDGPGMGVAAGGTAPGSPVRAPPQPGSTSPRAFLVESMDSKLGNLVQNLEVEYRQLVLLVGELREGPRPLDKDVVDQNRSVSQDSRSVVRGSSRGTSSTLYQDTIQFLEKRLHNIDRELHDVKGAHRQLLQYASLRGSHPDRAPPTTSATPSSKRKRDKKADKGRRDRDDEVTLPAGLAKEIMVQRDGDDDDRRCAVM